MEHTQAAIGIIGGTGLYSLFTDGTEEWPDTPYGKAGAPLTVGKMSGRTVAFLPRHGRRHEYAPHNVNYRANVWSLEKCGVTRVISVGAVGSLTPRIPPGSLVVPDQLVDRTTGRAQTYVDGPGVAHAPFADPFCPAGRQAALRAAEQARWPAVNGGTQVVVEGPRFSTRAESQWYAGQGWTTIGMTAHPEAVLARELGLCYVPLSMVTDWDAGVLPGHGVTQDDVVEAFAANVVRMRDVLAALVEALPTEDECNCRELKPSVL
ncbi:S-methyl-5'-thioadenosine phosphorylase [Streptomyces sp. NPDC017056]|uniref:S-methyl-5'-thioadenosine phosphorylase n=1 Tax=Streptomyces sp. NPDC017056 TaxID=3364973 RepID=UPI00378A8A82